MIIYGPTHAAYDFDIGPVLIQDYFHEDYYQLIQHTLSDNVCLPAFLS